MKILTHNKKSPDFYILVFIISALSLSLLAEDLFPKIISLKNSTEIFSAIIYIIFIICAWVYGAFYTCLIIFAFKETDLFKKIKTVTATLNKSHNSSVAIIYTTYNDFSEKSLKSCLNLTYSNYHIYILDDSIDDNYKIKIDLYNLSYKSKISVIRRKNRIGYKAGNINNALKHIVADYVVICDADEILPTNFIEKCLDKMEADAKLGFIQAVHVCDYKNANFFAKSMGVGIELFWRFTLSIRNKYGFTMCLGHGVMLRKSVLDRVNFPEIVAEDLAVSIEFKMLGYHGFIDPSIICMEAYPDKISAFRRRHVKWVKGTMEFLALYTSRIIKNKSLHLIEKIDIFIGLFQVFLGASLIPFFLSLSYLLAVNSTLTIGVPDYIIAISIYMGIAPFLVYGLPLLLLKRPFEFFASYTLGIAVYVATSILTLVSIISYLIYRKADFLVTGNAVVESNNRYNFLRLKNPNSISIYLIEMFFGLLIILISQHPSSIGFGLILIMYPIITELNFNNRTMFLACIGPLLILFGYVFNIISLPEFSQLKLRLQDW